MALRKFRSGALRNKCSSPLLFGSETYFICFSPAKGGVNFAEKLLAIFSPALTFSLVLSLVSRQEKERSSESSLQPNLKVQVLDGICSFSFARPKENEPKEKGALRKWFRQLSLSEASRPPTWEAILIYGDSCITVETPKIASSGIVRASVEGGQNSIFARGICPRSRATSVPPKFQFATKLVSFV